MIHSERGIDWMLRYQLGCSGTSWDAPTPAGMLRHQLGCSGTNYEKKIRIVYIGIIINGLTFPRVLLLL